jgi:DNA-binding transcriptional LysR family regulator
MSNIPTDLLRTLVTVVDQRSFTRAARSLGLTQPAVSAHIKRLQTLLRSEIFDRSGPGVSLTAKGEVILDHARHLLSINDLILHVAEPGVSAPMLRIGVPSDFLGCTLPHTLANFRKRWPDLRFVIRPGGLEQHLNDLRNGQLEIAIGLSMKEPAGDPCQRWLDQMVWVRGRSTRLDPAAPVPLVTFSEDCVYYRAAVDALRGSGRESELVFTGPTIVSLAAAINAGLGIMALPRSRVWTPNLTIWDDAPLPKPSDLVWGVYLREGGEREPLDDLADTIAGELRARTVAIPRPGSARGPKSTVVFARRAAS